MWSTAVDHKKYTAPCYRAEYANVTGYIQMQSYILNPMGEQIIVFTQFY